MIAYLNAPEQFWKLTPEQLNELTNGCGPGKFWSKFIPDQIWGLDISIACRIHDYMYAIGENILDKEEADRTFLNNMERLIQAGSQIFILVGLRRRAAKRYYDFVVYFGGPAFWKNKNPEETMQLVTI